MTPVYRSAGQWCDVCTLPDGRIAFVRAEGSAVVCEIDGVEAWRVAVPAPLLMLRCAFVPTVNSVVAIGQANDVGGPAMLVWPAAVNNLGPTAGNNPVAITPTNAYMVIAPDRVRVISLLNAVATEQAIPWTSQGIRDVVGTTIVLGDATYAGVVGGQNFGEYQTRGALTVGQHGNGIGVLIGSQFFVPRQGPINYNVHGAQSGSRIAVCAWTEGGSYYQEFTPPYPVVAAPPPPPVPVPPPTPEPPKMSTPNDLGIALAVAAQHPELTRLNTSSACGQLVEYIAVAMNAHDANWGLLSKRPGEHQFNGHAIDAVIYKSTQQVIDLMSGAGDRDPDSGVPANQQFDIRVKWEETGKRDGNDWMAPIATSVPVPPTQEPPPVAVPPAPAAPPFDSAPLLAKLDEVIAAINQTSVNEIAKLDELKVSIIAASKDVTKVLSALAAGGGLGGILGGVLGKKS